MASAINVRIVGLELEQNIGTLKAAVDAVHTTVAAFNLRSVDGDLPTGAQIKDALTAYDAISKPVVSMTDDLAAIRA
jgi:hypothetical protein